MKNDILQLFEELIEGQKKVLLEKAHQHISHLTMDDILQPNDFPVLENDPLFRYEEGILAGMQTVQTALSAILHERVRLVGQEERVSLFCDFGSE